MVRILLTPDMPLYAIDGAVGRSAPNARADVLLVQYLLRVAGEKLGGDPGWARAGERPIQIDGLCGPQTIEFITYFQAEQKRRGFPVMAVDGRIDPPRSRHGTLWALNVEVWNRRANRCWDLRGDSFFPMELARLFYI